MREDWKEITANKAAFIEALLAALEIDERSGIDCLAYEVSLKHQDEYIHVIFKDGSARKILATGNSNFANAVEILEAVYG